MNKSNSNKYFVRMGKNSLFLNTLKTNNKYSKVLKPLCILLLLLLCYLPGKAQQFTTYNAWDFESETLGAYGSASILQDFNVSGNINHPNQASIVMDTINNIPTKVFKVTHEEDSLYAGFEMNVDLGEDYEELYLSYNIKFDKDFNSVEGGKIPGLGGLPNFGTNCPTSGDGFRAHNLFKRAGQIFSYHYDRTSIWCPWSIDEYDYDTIYFNNGNWYNVTQRLVLNSFTGGTANADGIKELWVDGRLIFQKNDIKYMENEHDTMKIDAFRLTNFCGGSGTASKPLNECYTYFDNFKVYMPGDDSISGYDLHHPSTVLPTPDEITERTVYYDSLVTSQGTLSNTQYGGAYGACIDEAFLIDAGEGRTVEFNVTAGTIGSGDYLFFYDGNTTDAKIIDMVKGFNSAIGPRESTGRYMFVRFSSDRLDVSTGWTGTISFEGNPVPPDAPTNLEVTDSTSNSITIEWEDQADNETRFIIERSLSGAGFAVIDSVNANIETYTNSGLSVDTTYYYRVKARNGSGDSDYSDTVCSRLNFASPTTPTNLHVTDSTSNSISMAWNDSDNEDKYIIERSLTSGSGFAVIDSVNANVTSYTNTGLTAETTYYYKVKARNSNGDSGYSNEEDGTTLPESGTDTTWVSTMKVNFAPSGYSGGSEWNDFLTFTSSSSLSLDDSLGSSTGYTLYNEDTWSGAGSGGETSGPYPQNVNQTYWYRETSECDLELRNLDNDNLYSIEVYGSRDIDITREMRITIGSSFDIVTINNNTSDKAVFPYVSPSSGVIRIEITVETDDYSYLNALVVREYEVSGEVPTTPTNLHVTDSTSNSISMAWNDSDNEDKYIIERSLTSGSGFAVIDSVNANVTSYTNTGLTAETTYYYRVKARNSNGDSGYSNEENGTTLSEPVADTTWVSTMKVNFAPSGYSGGSEWNDFLTYTSTSSLSLDDSLGNSTGYTLYNEDTWSGSGDGGETSGPYPQNVNQTYWYRQTSECDLELRNLDNDNLYSIEVYGSRDIDITREMRITIGGSYDIVTIDNNTSDKAIFPYVSPSSGVIRIEVTVETDDYSYVNAIVIREYEVSGSTPTDTIAKINFMNNGFAVTGWVNLTAESGDYPADLGNNISLSRSGSMDDGINGEPTTIFPTKVSSSYCFIENNNETPVVFTVSGMDTTRAYTFDFFTSRDDASASGDRTTSFTIGANTVSLNPIGNIDSLLTISDVSPNSSGNISVTMSKLTGQYGYINAMIITDIGEKSASLSRNDNIFQGEWEIEQLRVFPNPGSTMITIAGFDKAIEIKIVDMLGKVVFQKGYAAKSTQVDVSNLKKGLYLIMLKTENNYHMKKFIKN